LVLKNFKRFKTLELEFDPELNILVGGNEAGKSSVLQAMDIVLSASRSKVESIGLEALFNADCIAEFLAGARKVADLPELLIEVYFDGLPGRHDLDGRNNSKGADHLGIKMVCRPADEYTREIQAILAENHLSHVHMRKLIERIRASVKKQLFVATHSSFIATRLNLKKVLILSEENPSQPASLKNLSQGTTEFFMKAPDNNVLELALCKKAILVDGRCRVHPDGSALQAQCAGAQPRRRWRPCDLGRRHQLQALPGAGEAAGHQGGGHP
jgi:hypothetical protein